MLYMLFGFALVVGQCCQAQPMIAVLNVTEGSCVSVPCECAGGSSSLIQWLRDADVDGVAEQKISCSGSKCKITECDNGQIKTEQGRYNMLPNGTLQISRVHMNDSGLYRCLKQTRQVTSTHCDLTPTLCASREQHLQQGDSGAQDHWYTTFLLSISALPTQEYKLSVHTGSLFRSGTDANMFIYLCGEFTCVKSELKTSTRDPFEKGQTDEFAVYGPYLGHLTHLKIWHDGAGALPSWFLKRVTVKEPQSGMSYTFTCDCWIYGNSPKTLSAQDLELRKKKILCKTFLTENHQSRRTNSERMHHQASGIPPSEKNQTSAGGSEDDQTQTFLTPSTTKPTITSSWEFLWTLMGVGLFLLGFLLITTIVLVSRKFCFYKENMPPKTSIQKQTRNQVYHSRGKKSKTTCKLGPTNMERVLKNQTGKVDTNSTAIYVNLPLRTKTTENRRTETMRHVTARPEYLAKIKRNDGETCIVATYENWRQDSKL